MRVLRGLRRMGFEGLRVWVFGFWVSYKIPPGLFCSYFSGFYFIVYFKVGKSSSLFRDNIQFVIISHTKHTSQK